jgi:hypothetical protein
MSAAVGDSGIVTVGTGRGVTAVAAVAGAAGVADVAGAGVPGWAEAAGDDSKQAATGSIAVSARKPGKIGCRKTGRG